MLACYGPYTILGSVSSLRGYSFEINIANEFCFCLLYLNSCLNPVLYCWKIRDVKQEVKKTICKFLCFWFYLLWWREVQLASYNGSEGSLAWILDSSSWIPDSRHWIPVFVSGTWILDSNRNWDSGFLELYSGFQSQGFRIPWGKISRIPDTISKIFLGVGGMIQQNNEDTRRPRKVLRHILPVHTKKWKVKAIFTLIEG